MIRPYRQRAVLLVTLLAAGALAPLLAACGGSGQITVSMAYADQSNNGPFKPSDTPQLVVTVVNNGPGDAPGVAVRVDLPSMFRYKAAEISGSGDARTQPLDAHVGSSIPEWGFWDIAAPSAGDKSYVAITFTLSVQAPPGTYTVTGSAQGDNTAGSVTSNDLKLTLNGAPQLGMNARVQAGTLKGGDTATYSFTLTNTGTGPASNLALLVALPPVMTFQRSVTPFAGNASRSRSVDPVKGSVEVFYSGWLLPAASSAGPGIVTVVFVAQVVAQPAGGMFSVNAQLTDDEGDVVMLTGAAPVTVQAAPSPSPSIGATPSTPTASPH